MKDLNILMTGAGAPGAPGIIKCLKKNGERSIRIVGVDVKDRVPTINMLDAFYSIPSATDSCFVDKVLEICEKEKIEVIQPLVTRELEVFANNIDLFNQRNIKICVSPIQNLKIANDKGLLLLQMKEAGLIVPDFYIVNTIKEFEDAVEKLNYPKSAICFKPTKSNGSRGFRIVDPNINRGDLLFKEKPNSTYICFDDAIEILSSYPFPELLVMEYMPGDEYSIDVLADFGKALVTIPRKRIALNGGISTNCIIENNQEIIDYCERIVSLLSLDGNIGIQVRKGIDGKFKILEINPRVQGTIVACFAAGANMPYLAIKKKLGEKIPNLKIKWGVQMIRHWEETYFDSDGHAYSL